MGGFAQIFKGLVGGDPLKSIGDLIEQFHLSPEQKAQMEQAAQQLEVQRDQIEAARDQALAEIVERNVESARAMQIATRGRVVAVLSYAVTAGFFGCLYLMIFKPVPVTNQAALNIVTGVLGTAWITIVNFHFGSSAGSAAKTETLSALVTAPPPPRQVRQADLTHDVKQ
jgi:hypothetical protein